MRWEERFVTVVREGGHSLFFERFLQAVEVTSLVIVSPWIQSLDEEPVSLKDILWSVERGKVPTTIIMRSPQKESLNRDTAELFGGWSCDTDIPSLGYSIFSVIWAIPAAS